LARQVLAQQRDQGGANRDRSSALALRLFLDNAALDRAAGDGTLPVHVYDTAVEIHFGPFETR
jgi:hypothetical protein